MESSTNNSFVTSVLNTKVYFFNLKKYIIASALIFGLLFSSIDVVGQCGTVNHGGANWTITSNTTVGGNHINVGTFTINAGVTVTVDPACKFFYVEAVNINILGTINANGAGGVGGTGGAFGGLWADDGSTDGRGITSCWRKDDCRALGQGGGLGGAAGSGTGGGLAGSAGGMGYGAKQRCRFIGDYGGAVGGGGGGGGGSGGSYGGVGGLGRNGGIGGNEYACDYSGCQTLIVGSAGTGGNSQAVYGTTNNENIEWGSGGSGGGGGGKGSYAGFTSGGIGGAGGGAVRLIASGNLICSGNIFANGTNGGNGGNGGENNYTEDCCSDPISDCTGQTFSGPGGGGAGAGEIGRAHV